MLPELYNSESFYISSRWHLEAAVHYCSISPESDKLIISYVLPYYYSSSLDGQWSLLVHGILGPSAKLFVTSLWCGDLSLTARVTLKSWCTARLYMRNDRALPVVSYPAKKNTKHWASISSLVIPVNTIWLTTGMTPGSHKKTQLTLHKFKILHLSYICGNVETDLCVYLMKK